VRLLQADPSFAHADHFGPPHPSELFMSRNASRGMQSSRRECGRLKRFSQTALTELTSHPPSCSQRPRVDRLHRPLAARTPSMGRSDAPLRHRLWLGRWPTLSHRSRHRPAHRGGQNPDGPLPRRRTPPQQRGGSPTRCRVGRDCPGRLLCAPKPASVRRAARLQVRP
jgi:hypothetical protein